MRRSLGEHTKALGLEVDVMKDVDASKPDLRIRLPRPRAKPKPDEPTPSKYVTEASAPDAQADIQKAYEESILSADAAEKLNNHEQIEQVVKTVDWGDFDVERIVHLMVEISKVLTGVTLLPYQLPFQRRIFRSVLLNDGETITGLWSRQAGKCLGRGTPVMMWDGTIKPVEDIQVGDLLMGDDSTPRRVLSLARGRDRMYKVVPTGGWADPYVVNSAHILSVMERGKRRVPGTDRRRREWFARDVPIEEYLKLPVWKRRDFIFGYKARVDEFGGGGHPLPVSPYWLGLWLGDGNSRGVAITTADEEVVEWLDTYGRSLGMESRPYLQPERTPSYAITNGTAVRQRNPLLSFLRDYELLANKHIPHEFLTADVSHRWELLAGLIDSDGHRSSAPGRSAVCEITFTNRRLADQTAWLARSLGLRASVKAKRAKLRSRSYEVEAYRVSLYGELWNAPTRILRKQYHPTELRENPLHHGFHVEDLGEGEYFGFVLDGNRRFLLGDFTVTHNTEASACAAVTLCVVLPALARHVFPEQLGPYKDGFYVGVYAPTGEQAHTLYNRILLRARSENSGAVYDDPEIDTKLAKYGCRWSNGSYVFHQSASLQSNVESKTYHLLITDETQGLAEYVINKSLEPMLAWNNGTFVHIGTTSEHPCLFYDVIQKNKMRDAAADEKDRTHFEYDYETVLKYNPRYRQHVERQIKKYGLHSRYFQMSYCLRWFFEEGMAVTDRDLKDFTMHVPVGITRYTDAPCVVGIDLARKTNSSVVTVGQLVRTEVLYEDDDSGAEPKYEQLVYVKVCDWLEINNVPYAQQRDMMKAFLEPYTNIRHITVDATRDDAMLEQMQMEWTFTRNIEPFIFSPKSKNYLMNLFYEFFWKQRLLIPSTEAARGTGRWQNFYLQMINLERTTSHGFTYLVKGHRENCRDDYPDSLFLMLHSAKMAVHGSAGIEVSDSAPLFRPNREPVKPGFAGIRQAVRNGTYRPLTAATTSLRQKRAEKLIQGILS